MLGDKSILDREDLSTAAGRWKNIDRLYQEVARLTPRRTTEEWMALLKAADIPAMVAGDIEDIFDDPHLSATGFFERREHPSEGGYFATRRAVRYAAWPEEPRAPAPLLGQHSAEILAEVATEQSAPGQA